MGLSTKVYFIAFYITFLSFVVYISGMAGGSILQNVPEFKSLPEPDVLNIFVTLQWFFALLSVTSTGYPMIFALVMFPMTAIFLYCLVEVVRGI
jgi:hypothetical protein